MPLPLLRKLRHFTRLSADDERQLESICVRRRRPIPPREDIMTEGAEFESVVVFESGWATRYRVLEDGRRQVMALLLPGDICDLDMLVIRRLDHSVTALSHVTVGEISRRTMDELFSSASRVRDALLWQHYVQSAIQREWTVNLGQRTAHERMAHLLCEIYTRLSVVGLVTEGRCDFPLTQTELGETLGLSSVHVNRVLQDLRAEGLIVLRDRTLQVLDFGGLAATAQFDPGYLHLDHEGRALDAESGPIAHAPPQ